MKDAKTNFAGFAVPGAAMTMVAAGTCSDDDVAQGKQMLDKLKTTATKQLEDNEDLSDKQKELGKQLLSDAFDVARQTVELKKSDAGLAVVLEDNPAMIAGWAIAAGDKLDATFKKLAKGDHFRQARGGFDDQAQCGDLRGREVSRGDDSPPARGRREGSFWRRDTGRDRHQRFASVRRARARTRSPR